MSSNTSKTWKRILTAAVQNLMAHEANETTLCPTVWSYQPHRPEIPFLKTSKDYLNKTGKF